jgi:hypothetical protein
METFNAANRLRIQRGRDTVGIEFLATEGIEKRYWTLGIHRYGFLKQMCQSKG